MQKIVLLVIGKLKESWSKDAATFYEDRLKHAIKLEVVELPPSKEKDPTKQKDDESGRLLDAAKKIDGDRWILDERGKGMTSIQFTSAIGEARDAGQKIVFILGGSYGLTDDVRAAGKLLKLSDMVLPHELCRVVFLEQLYRASEIQKGSGYHH
jgi:23S rRNA (pseudouridine1915-N3)-methyltransferase